MKRGRSLWAGAALIALAIALGSIPAQAGRSPAAVQAATGCLTTRHKWVKVALGDNPSSASMSWSAWATTSTPTSGKPT